MKPSIHQARSRHAALPCLALSLCIACSESTDGPGSDADASPPADRHDGSTPPTTDGSGRDASAGTDASADTGPGIETPDSDTDASSPRYPETVDSGVFTFRHLGLDRSYRLQVPESYENTTSHKLVLLFHGWGGDENDFLAAPGVIDEANARGIILVAPRGLSDADGDVATVWNDTNSWTFRGSSSGLSGDAAKICDDAVTPNYNYSSCEGGLGNDNSCAWTHCIQDDVVRRRD